MSKVPPPYPTSHGLLEGKNILITAAAGKTGAPVVGHFEGEFIQIAEL